LVLIFMIDALGAVQAANGSFLAEPLLPELEQPRAPIRSVLGYSSAAIPTIMTGQPPDRHGHFSMYRLAQGDGVFRGFGPWLRLAERAGRGGWRIRRWMTGYLRRRGITGYFALYDIPLGLLPRFDLCQRRDLYAPGAFPQLRALPDFMQERARPRVWNWAVPEDRAFHEMEGEIRRGEGNVLFLYTPGLDSIMHAHGPEGEATRRRLRDYGKTISRLISLAREGGRDVRVFVFGDHGMAPVTGRRDLWAELKGLPFSMPRDYLAFLDSTMARFWFFDDAARREIGRLLQSLDYGRVLTDAELQGLGVYFPAREYGETIFLLREGEILVPSFVAGEGVAGMHGYHPDDRCSSTTLLTNVALPAYPRDLIELHAVLRREIEEVGR